MLQRKALRQLSLLSSSSTDMARLLSTPVSTEEDRYIQTSPLPTMHFQNTMFRLRVPLLEKTLKRYLEALEPVAQSPEAFERTKEVLKDSKTKKLLRSTHAKLFMQNMKSKHTSYIQKVWFDNRLSDRRPLVLNSNTVVNLNDDPDITDQAMRAANLVWSAVRFRASLLDDQLLPDVRHLNQKKKVGETYWKIMRWVPGSMSTYVSALMKVFALDMSQYHSLFNSTRLPVLHAQDELVGYESSDQSKYGHVLVLRNDNMYTVRAVQDDGLPVPVQTLYNQLQGILDDQTPPSPHPLGCLTGLDRDRWAQLREDLRHDNLDLLEAIDSALFVVCLDETTPTSPEGLTHQMLHNYGRNRWFDKSFQLIITPEAQAAVNFEQSWGDGMAVQRLAESIGNDRKAVLSMCEPTMEGVRRLEFNVPASVREGSSSALTQLRDTCSSLSVNMLVYQRYGTKFLEQMKLNPEAVMQLAIQVAYYRQFNACVPSSKTYSLSAFKHGCTEVVRPATMATKNLAAAFNVYSPNFDPTSLLKLITKADIHHTYITRDTVSGQGFDGHMLVLQKMSESEGEEIPVFTDPSYAHMNHIILSTGATLAAPKCSDGYGVDYSFAEDSIAVRVTAYCDRECRVMVELIDRVLSDLHAVFSTVSR